MNFVQALEYLKELEKLGFILGLDNIKALMKALGSPDKKLKYIHIGGTNGKGSVGTYISSVLKEAGHVTGFYSSPSIVEYGERIRINGVNIPDDKVGEYMGLIKEVSQREKLRITAFEAETAMAILYFVDQGVDYAVLEVGLGGTQDATNFIEKPELVILTNIGIDHIDFLGETIEEIAGEKAGIIKKNSTVLSYFQEKAVEEVLQRRADQEGARLEFLKKDDTDLVSRDISGQVFTYQDCQFTITMVGDYQIYNASLAIMAIKKLKAMGVDIGCGAIQEGMKKAQIPGRFQVFSTDPLIILDGGHNPQGVQALVDSLEAYFGSAKHRMVFGSLGDKDYKEGIRISLPYAEKYYTLRPNNPRALASDKLAEEIEAAGGQAQDMKTTGQAMEKALEERTDGEAVVVFGSLYQLKEAYEYFERTDKWTH